MPEPPEAPPRQPVERPDIGAARRAAEELAEREVLLVVLADTTELLCILWLRGDDFTSPSRRAWFRAALRAAECFPGGAPLAEVVSELHRAGAWGLADGERVLEELLTGPYAVRALLKANARVIVKNAVLRSLAQEPGAIQRDLDLLDTASAVERLERAAGAARERLRACGLEPGGAAA